MRRAISSLIVRAVDLLSDILRDLRLESTVLSVFELHAPWGLRKQRLEGGAPFHVVIEGRCVLRMEHKKPTELAAGDLVVLPHGDAHTLSSSASAPVTPFKSVLLQNGVVETWAPGKRAGRPAAIRFGSAKGEVVRVISGVFAFQDRRRNPVLEVLPPLIRVAGEHGRGPSWLENAIRLLIDEAFSEAPGALTIAERVADILFVQAVRAYIASERDAPSSGWLRGLLDPSIGRALSLVHARAAEPWTVERLARAVGLSRTVFAQRFRRLVGETVMAYVTHRRMHLAAGLLCTSNDGLAQIAEQVGYETEVTFSKAFRVWAGEPPGRYRRRMREAAR
ncbi:Transcriptional regulator, AraC family [Cystobacter fuscus DSM 2262]|uniref:Transcriptional regulator, AraC family n=1 Tax=Cystobacter fuscus (strain ATCC 25194 / DSM 2262 / NBRC 100088 / M29) TaxID=1242864 RepID=S9PHZ6_CYSF2|nr:AraC family transcriptional regulator [Cystobacter fuscus]EPX63960.1 Transcriptional regulator, AraC family [Cystobacter fuscus DSM 2262]